ncbi:MAG: cytochrome P450, partial [Myxococcota bacterium]
MDLRTKLMDLGQAGQLALQVAREWWETGILFSAFGKSFQNDPYPIYRELRERDPIHRSYAANGWILTRYRDIEPLLSDSSFSADDRNLSIWEKLRAANIRRGVTDPDEEFEPTMLRRDPPAHTRLRGLVNKAFTPRAVEKLKPRIEEIVDELMSDIVSRGSMDLVRDLAVPLPIIVIAEMLGIPSKDREQFKIWSTDFANTIGRVTPEALIRARLSGEEFTEYIGQIAEERRREPRADLLSGLVAAEAEGDRLSETELAGTCALLLAAGNETTTNLICNGVLALLQNPEQLEELRGDPGLIENAVEEFLR